MEPVKSVDCPIIAKDCVPTFPVYHNSQIILSIEPYESLLAGSYAYDILTEQFIIFASCSEGFQLDSHGMAIDRYNNEIYLFSGDPPVFAIYNMSTKQRSTKQLENMETMFYPRLFHVNK